MASSTLLLWFLIGMGISAQELRDGASTATRHVAAKDAVNTLRVIKAGDGVAAIRTDAGTIETVKVGDVVGTSRAAVKEISAARLVLEEAFTGKDGAANRALIIIKEGERGGTRYLQRADEPPAIDVKPVPTSPGSAYGAKPAPKKPPQM